MLSACCALPYSGLVWWSLNAQLSVFSGSAICPCAFTTDTLVDDDSFGHPVVIVSENQLLSVQPLLPAALPLSQLNARCLVGYWQPNTHLYGCVSGHQIREAGSSLTACPWQGPGAERAGDDGRGESM